MPLRKPEKKLAAAEKAAAIKRHLEIILNARQGGASSSPEFGLADFNGAAVGASDMILAMVENISNTIRDYEPRVIIESVVYKPRAEFPLELNFSISGYIKAGDYQEKIEIDMAMNGLNRHCTILRGENSFYYDH